MGRRNSRDGGWIDEHEGRRRNPPNSTSVTPVNAVPLMVTAVPPATGPPAGATRVTAGWAETGAPAKAANPMVNARGRRPRDTKARMRHIATRAVATPRRPLYSFDRACIESSHFNLAPREQTPSSPNPSGNGPSSHLWLKDCRASDRCAIAMHLGRSPGTGNPDLTQP